MPRRRLPFTNLVLGLALATTPASAYTIQKTPWLFLEYASQAAGQALVDQWYSDSLATMKPIDTSIPRYNPGANLGHRLEYRNRVLAPFSESSPAVWNRATFETGNWKFSGLIARDAGESNPADLWRLSAEWNRSSLRMVAGDFQVNQGLGWTVRSAPALPAGYAVMAPEWQRDGGLQVNRSSEEGRGWKGLGVRKDWRTLNTSIWAGRAFYDARPGLDGPLPYSTQGDHSGSRSDFNRNLGESHAGARMEWRPRLSLLDTDTLSTRFAPVAFGLTAAVSRWDTPLASSGLSSRYRTTGSRRTWRSIGGDFLLRPSANWRIAGEVATQHSTAWGGAVTLRRDLPNAALLGMGYRATQAFEPLHARPFLPFGDDPAGRTGIYTGFETAFRQWSFGGWWAGEQREAGVGGASEEERHKVRLIAWGPLTRTWTLDIRIAQSETDLGARFERRRSIRGHLFRELSGRRYGLRAEEAWEDDGEGALLAMYNRERICPGVHATLQLAWVRQHHDGASVTLIEPYAPGLFPFRQVATEGLYGSLVIDAVLWGRLEGWTRARLTRTLETTRETRRRVDIGLRWRFQTDRSPEGSHAWMNRPSRDRRTRIANRSHSK